MNKQKLGIALVGLEKYSEGQLAPALKETKHCELRGIVREAMKKPGNGKRNISCLTIIYNYQNSLALISILNSVDSEKKLEA